MCCPGFELNPRTRYSFLAAEDEVKVGTLQSGSNFVKPFRTRRNAEPVRRLEYLY
jgi:hypothetical protein